VGGGRVGVKKVPVGKVFSTALDNSTDFVSFYVGLEREICSGEKGVLFSSFQQLLM
jgi:hypothetical protein